jgi:hypothetical protein
MPVRQQNRHKGPTRKLTLRMDELTLVAETYSEDDFQDEQAHQKPRRRAKKPVPAPQDAHGGIGEDPMLIDNVELQPIQHHVKENHEPLRRQEDVQRPHEHRNPQQNRESGIPRQHDEREGVAEAFEENTNEPMPVDKLEREGAEPHHGEDVQSQNEDEHPEQLHDHRSRRQSQPTSSAHQQKTDIAARNPSAVIQTPLNPKYGLKRQESTNRHVSFVEEQSSPEAISRSSLQRGGFGRKESDDATLSQQIKAVSAPRKSSKMREQEELEASQQLNMVTAPRPPSRASNSEDEQSYSEEESEEEESSNEDEEHTPESSSQEEDTDEPEPKHMDPVAIEEDVEQENSDEEGTPEPMLVDEEQENIEEEIPLGIGGKVPVEGSAPKSLMPQETVKSIVSERKVPQAAIPSRKPEQLAVPVDSPCSLETQTHLQQLSRFALDAETHNSIQGRNDNASQNIESPDGSWRPTQPSSCEVHSEKPNIPAVGGHASPGTDEKDNVNARSDSALPRPGQMRRNESIPLQSENPDDSYRPTQPISSGKLIEVAEDIDTSPTPILSRQRALSQRRSQSQRLAQQRRQSQPLRLVRSSRSPELGNNAADYDTQGSVELGGTQREIGRESQGSIELGGNQTLLRHQSIVNNNDSQGSTILGGTQPLVHQPSVPKAHGKSSAAIPESQFEPETELELEHEVRESQQSHVPDSGSYFTRASQQLQDPVRSSRLSRTKSTPARPAFFGLRNENSEMMAKGITMAEAFSYTPQPSPIKHSPSKTSRLPTLPEEGSSQQKSLKTLARQASVGMGTMPGTARKRMKSLPFIPPFKLTPDGEINASTA